MLLVLRRNHSEKSINSILDYISTSKQMELLQNFYETTLDALRDAKVSSIACIFYTIMIILSLLVFSHLARPGSASFIRSRIHESPHTVDLFRSGSASLLHWWRFMVIRIRLERDPNFTKTFSSSGSHKNSYLNCSNLNFYL